MTVLYFCRFHFKIVDLFTVNRKVCWFILLLSSSPVSHDNGCVKCTMDTRWSMDNIWLILIGRWPQIKFCPIKPWTGSGLQWPWLLTFFHQILIRPPWSQCENLYYLKKCPWIEQIFMNYFNSVHKLPQNKERKQLNLTNGNRKQGVWSLTMVAV